MTNETLDFTQSQPAQAMPADIAQTAPFQNQLPGSIPASVDANEEEEALEQYMNSMLERLTGSTKPAPAVTQPQQPIEAIVEDTPVAPAATRETLRPSQLHENLSGMRELANRTVESALGAHASGRLVKSTKSALAAALGLSLVSTLLVLMGHNSSYSWTYPAAIGGTVVASLASLRYFILARRLAKIDERLRVAAE